MIKSHLIETAKEIFNLRRELWLLENRKSGMKARPTWDVREETYHKMHFVEVTFLDSDDNIAILRGSDLRGRDERTQEFIVRVDQLFNANTSLAHRRDLKHEIDLLQNEICRMERRREQHQTAFEDSEREKRLEMYEKLKKEFG